MRIPLSWLREYFEETISTENLCQQLTNLGIEVEEVIEYKPSFSEVVVAKVTSVSAHPNADKLCVAQVDDGRETFQVVCGAPNCREGLLVAFAKIGAKLGITTDGSCEVEIKKAQLRDVESFGMLCGEDELGLGEDSFGIAELDSTFSVGDDLAARFSDTVLDVAFTPNLGYCLSIEGVAREVASSLGLRIRPPYLLPALPSETAGWNVDLIASEECPSYAALSIRETSGIYQAPLEMRVRLKRAGFRSVNGAVDCANYAMLSIGQPLHAFDAQAFPGKQIVVSLSKGGESIKVIDGSQVDMEEGHLLISSTQEPLAIAGVMGGEKSAVNESTRDILVESAFFDTRAIRRSGKVTGIFSEALRRFERGVDPNGFMRALQLFWYFFSKISSESILDGYVCVGRKRVSPKTIICRCSKARSVLGVEVSRQSMELVFSRMGYPYFWVDNDTISVEVPAYRHDVVEEIDVVEDIAKMLGLMTSSEKRVEKVSFSHLSDHPMYVCEQKVKKTLISLCLQEFVTCDLISPSLVSLVEERPVPKHAIISMANSGAQDHSVLRPSLFPGLVHCLERNISYGQRSVAAFEVGTVHLKNKEKFSERLVAGVLLSGDRFPYHHSDGNERFDFFDLKGILDRFSTLLSIPELEFQPGAISLFHDGRQATVSCKGHQVGMLGEIHPKVLEQIGIDQRVYFMELDVQDLFENRIELVAMKSLAQFPCIERDVTFTCSELLSYQKLEEVVRSYCPEIVEKVELQSLFKHEKIGADKKNMTLRFVFRDANKTLARTEVDRLFSLCVDQVCQSLGISAMGIEKMV